MPLASFFEDQVDQLKAFFMAPDEVVRCVQVAPDIKQVFQRVLIRLDEEEDNPHVFFYVEPPFEEAEAFFEVLYGAVHEVFAKDREALLDEGVDVQPLLTRFAEEAQPGKFVAFYSALADALPDEVGSLVLVLDPPEVLDSARYRLAVRYVADYVTSPWAKLLVIDDVPGPLLDGLDGESERVGVQVFHLSPDDIEQQSRADLAGGALSREEQRQYTSLQAGFAFGKKDYDRALTLQTAWLQMAKEDNVPTETANAYYNLGNTHLEKRAYADAETCFADGAELCLDEQIDDLLPLMLTNLGVAVFHQERYAEALECFTAARDTAKALNNKPCEAHVLDCMARTCQADGMNRDAEEFWWEALTIYRDISSDAFVDLREAGEKDIVHKLEEHYKATGQAHKIPALKQGAPTSHA